MKVKKDELAQALSIVKPGLASKEMIEQSTSFAFMGDRVVTYNDEISISHPVPGLDATGAVKADALYQFLARVKQEEIDIEWEDTEVKITAGKTKAGLVLESEVRLPVAEIGEIGTWQDLPEGILGAMRLCGPCCSKDMSRPMLTCLHIVSDGTVEAADVHQIIRVSLGEEIPIASVLLPSSSANELAKYKVTKVAEGEGWLHFKTAEDTVFSCRVFEGEFPNVSDFLDVGEGVSVEFPAKMLEVLERSEVFATSRDIESLPPEVLIDISSGKVQVSAKNDFGWFEETFRIRYKGDAVSFRTNPDLLTNALKQSLSCTIAQDRIKFGGDSWEYVIASVVGE